MPYALLPSQNYGNIPPPRPGDCSLWSEPGPQQALEARRSVFCNRALNMKHIKVRLCCLEPHVLGGVPNTDLYLYRIA